MTPLKIFLSLRAWLERKEALNQACLDDPFKHPDIRAMSLRELADLPFPGRACLAAKSGTVTLAKCA